MKDHRPSTLITFHQDKPLPTLPLPPTSTSSFAPPSRQPRQRSPTPAPATSLELDLCSPPPSNFAMSPPPPRTPTRLHRRAHPSPPTTPSYHGEEDIFFTPSFTRDGSMPPTPTSPTFSIPRSTSPHASFVKKFSNKWKGSAATSRDELDFGCAGEWSAAGGPADLGDRYYSSHHSANRASTSSSSSVLLPSLTHSRAHSSSSEFSTTSTMDSSLPPSPTPSSCASLASTSSTSSPLQPALPYTSRVPLVPRSKRHASPSTAAEESLALDAMSHFFTTSVRLSQIAEDVSPASTARASFSSTYRGSSPPTAADILLSKNHAPPPPPSSNHGFEIEFIDMGGESTFTPLDLEHQGSTFTPAPNTSLSRHTPSPIPDSDVANTLEELSEYFSSPGPSPCPSSPSSPSLERPRQLLPAVNIVKRPTMRPTRSGAAGVRIGLELSPSPREGREQGEARRVQYAWI